MERNREGRRGTMAAVNGGGLSRRRQRSGSGSFRDSPEEDGGMEMPETSRLRDRGSKKDRDRDRSSRIKRRRGERLLQGRHDGESSEESLDDEEDEDDEMAAVRVPPRPFTPPNSASSPYSALQQQDHHHHHHHKQDQLQQQQQQRRSFPPKVVRPPPTVWKADEMIGVAVPRKARSAMKRSHESWVSGGSSGAGGVGVVEHVTRQGSTSSARLSPASNSQISPSSSNASIRKKLKPVSGSKHRPPKIGRPSSSSPFAQEDLEIEVAEVLFEMTKQFRCPLNQENHKLDSRELDGESGNEAKSRVPSPNSVSASPASHPSVIPPSNSSSSPHSLNAIVPKRKRPRPVKIEDESPSSPAGASALESTSGSSAAKAEKVNQLKTETLSPTLEQNNESPNIANGISSIDGVKPQATASQQDGQSELSEMVKIQVPDSKLLTREPVVSKHIETKEGTVSAVNENPGIDLDVNLTDATTKKSSLAAENAQPVKFTIDLMAPPPGKLSPERDELCNFDTDQKPSDAKTGMNVSILKKEVADIEKTAQADESLAELKVDKSPGEDSDLKSQVGKEKIHELQFDLEKLDKDSVDGNKVLVQKQQKGPDADSKPERTALTASPSTPITVAGWPGTFPPFGYASQVPPLQVVLSSDGASGSSGIMQPPNLIPPHPRPNRCVTHCYIAQKIYYHQRMARMNPFWSAAASTPALFGTKQYNLNAVPTSDVSLFGNAMQGTIQGRNLGSSQDIKGAAAANTFTGQPSKETPSGNVMAEVAERKQLVLHQATQSGAIANMLHGPTFLFPINQQQAAAAAAAAIASASASRSGNSNGASVVSGTASSMNLAFAGLAPNDAQYLAILQKNYPIPIPANVAVTPHYRGAAPAGTMPFFNSPFYSQLFHPSQLPQQQVVGQQQQTMGPQPSNTQQVHQNASTSSGSSSSQKHPQSSQRVLGGGSNAAAGSSHGLPSSNLRQHLLPDQTRHQENEKGSLDSPSTADSRVSQAQKNIFGHNFVMPIHPQNFAFMSTATASALGSGRGQADKQPQNQKQPQSQQKQVVKADLASSQAFAMPFTSFNGVPAASQGLDFSLVAQNNALLQSLPEASRQQYHHIAVAAAAAANVQAAQQKTQQKTQHRSVEDGTSVGEAQNGSGKTEEEKKLPSTPVKTASGGSQHTLSFSRPDGEPTISSILHSNVMDNSSRTMNLISNHSASIAPVTMGATVSVNLPSSQQIIQLSKQHKKQLSMQPQLPSSSSKPAASSNNACGYSERLPAGSAVTKFPQALPGFPQALHGGNPSQSQWKASARAATASSGAPSSQAASKTNHLQKQQGRVPQHPVQSHQTQISFAASSIKAVPAGPQHLSMAGSNPTMSSAAVIPVGSTHSSVLKSSTGAKQGSSTPVVPLPQQSSPKTSSSSSQKSSLLSNRNAPSILGQPIGTPSNSSTKPQQQQPHQSQKQPSFNQAQLFFTNTLMQQAQSAQPFTAAVAGTRYYQPGPPEQQSQQQPQQQNPPGSTGMVALNPSVGAFSTLDPAKAAAAAAVNVNSMKGLPPPNVLHAAQLAMAAQSASGSPYPLMPASFPYMSMPAVSMKPTAEQKPGTGNDNLHACWQSEKR